MSNVNFGIKIDLEGGQQVVQQTAQLGRSFGALETIAQRFGGVIGAVAGTALTRGFVQLADSVTVLRNQLALATGSVQQAEVAYSSLFSIAQRSRQSFTELGATFASISRATSELGISQGRLLNVTEAIGNAIAISGGSAQGAQAALIQLSQGFASGTLRGEELNSVMEQTPRLARAIAEGLGITIGQLRTMGQEGKLTAQAVLGALESQAKVLSGEVASSVTSVAQAMVVLGNAAVEFAGKVDKAGGITQKLSQATIGAANDLGRFGEVMERAEQAGEGFVGQLAAVAGLAAGRAGFGLLNISASALNSTINALTGGMAGLNENVQIMPLVLRTSAEQAQVLAQRLGEAEKELAAMQQQFADGKRDIYFRSAIGDMERYVDALRRAKEARDALGPVGAGAGRGSVNPETVGQTAARDAENARKLAQAMLQYGTATEKANAAVEKLKKELGGAFTPALEQRIRASFIKPTNDVAQELAKQASVLNDLLGVTDDYTESLRRLLAMRNAGKLSEEAYLAAVDKVIQRQPAIIAAERQRVAQAQEYLGMQELRAQGEQEIAEAEAQASRARQESIAQVEKQLQGVLDEAEAARLAAKLNIDHAQAIARLTLARLEDQRVRLVNDPAELAALERKIELQRQLVQATDENSARDRNTKAAADAAAAWQSTANDIRTALTDAFRRSFESGESFTRAFGQVIEREIKARLASALAGLVTDGILQVVSGAAGFAVSAASGSSSTTNWLQGASTAKNAYDLAAGGSVYAQAGNYAAVYSGQAYGTGFATQQSAMLAAQEAGMVSSAGSSTMGSWATSAGWVAAIALGVYKANQDYSEGFRREGAREVGRETGGAAGSFEFAQATLLSKLGFSDRLADLLSGATAVSKIIGRAAPRAEAAGVQGFLGSGDFAGDAFVDVVEKGGLFRSDKRYQQLSEVPEEIGRLLDGAAASVFDKAKAYGEALGLPVESLGQISTSIKVKLTDDADANLQAIVEAVGGYGDALVEGFADAIAPLANYGETTAETFERVGEAMAGVNEVLAVLGLSAVDASVAGAQAAISLQDLFGGVQGLQQAAGSYLQNFYTDAERTELALAGIGRVLGDVGVSVPATREEFRALVDAQDLTTEAGRRTFATLLGVADAFAAVVESGRSAADILAERQGLERQLLELQGDTAAIRALERDALDQSNRALYDQIKALEDQKDAADAAAEAAEKAADAAQRLAGSWRASVSDAEAGVRATYQAVKAAIESEQQRIQAAADQDIQRVQSEAETGLRELESQAEGLQREFGGLIDSLRGNIRALTGELAGDAGRAEALATLRGAAGALRSGGSVDFDAVRQAAGTASRVDAGGFATGFAFRREQADTANLLRAVSSAAGNQLASRTAQIAAQQVAIEQSRDAQVAAIEQARDAQLATLQAQLETARAAASALVDIDDGIKDVADAIARMTQAIGALGLLQGKGGPTGEVLTSGNTQVYGGAGGAVATLAVGGNPDDLLVRGKSGATATGAVLRQAIAELIAADNWARIVEVALQEGIDSNMVDAIAGLDPGTARAAAKLRGLPAFAAGTAYVPSTGVAMVHEGERILPAADNAALMRLLTGGGGDSLVAEVRALRAEVELLRKQSMVNDATIAANTGKTARLLDQFDVDGMPAVRT